MTPKDCTCTWTLTFASEARDPSFVSGSVYIADPDCPSFPHPRTILPRQELSDDIW